MEFDWLSKLSEWNARGLCAPFAIASVSIIRDVHRTSILPMLTCINKFDEVLCFFMALCWRLAVRAKVDGIFQLLCSMIKCAAFFHIFFVSFRKSNRFLIIFEVAVKIMANIIHCCSITLWMNRRISSGLLDLVFVMLWAKIHNLTKNCNNQLLRKETSFQWDYPSFGYPIAALSGTYKINSNWMGQKLGNEWKIRNRIFSLGKEMFVSN